MSEVAPPSPTPPPTGQAALPRLTVTQAPQQLMELALGAKIEAAVAALTDAAELKLASNVGEITVKLPANAKNAFKPGDALILNLVAKGAQPKVLITSADGKPLSLPAAPAQTPGAAGSAAASPAVQVTPPAGVQLAPGALVTATLLRPVVLNAQQVLQVPAQLSTATPGIATPASGASTPGLSGAQGGTAPTAQPSVPGRPAPAPTATAPVGTAQPSAPGTTPFPAGSGLQINILSVTLPSGPNPNLVPAPPAGTVSLAPGAQMTGVVSGNQAGGQVVVQTHAGPVTLPSAQPLPPGTEVRFEIVSLQAAQAGNAQHGLMHGAQAPMLDGDWQAFEDALGALRDAAPAAHQHIIQTALPRADAQLATNVLFFLSALRGGDIKNWLGDGPMRILERTRPDLAARLRTDMTQMTRTVDDPASGEWRLHGVPFLHGSELDRIQLLLRDRDAGDDDDDHEKDGTRFVVDLNLSRLGHLQIDGLVGDRHKRLDMVLRTDEPLPAHMREDIRRLFTDALDVTGLEGSVGFQAAPGKFVNVPKRDPGSAGDVMA